MNPEPRPEATPVPVDAFDPPACKDIEFCENRGCAFNANSGRCSSTIGWCYGYIPAQRLDILNVSTRS